MIDGRPTSGPGPRSCPSLLHLGPAAPCGLTRYESRRLRARLPGQPVRLLLQPAQGHAATCSTPTGAHVRDARTRISSSAQTSTSTRPTCSKTPTAACSSIDTGGWYKLCCPTLAAPEARRARRRSTGSGGRVRRRLEDPRGLKLAWKTPDTGRAWPPARRPASRRPAAGHREPWRRDEPARRRSDAVIRPGESRSRPVRNAGLGRDADRTTQACARRLAAWPRDLDETVRQAAIHSASVAPRSRRFALAGLATRTGPSLRTAGPPPRPRAASATSRPCPHCCGRRRADGGDRALEHSLTYALIEIGDPEGDCPGLASDSAHAPGRTLVAASTRWRGQPRAPKDGRDRYRHATLCQGDSLLDHRPASRMGRTRWPASSAIG